MAHPARWFVMGTYEAPFLRTNTGSGLENQGYSLEPRPDDNYRILARPPDFRNAGRELPDEIIVKDHYWVCLDDSSAACVEQHQSGNAIDFFMNIEGMTFRQAVELLLS